MINFRTFLYGFKEGFLSGFRLSTYRRFFQRIFRGWDDSVTWGLDISLYKWLLPRLKRFRELNNGWPDSKYNTFEDWNCELDKRIKQLEYIVENYFEYEDKKLNKTINSFNKWLAKDLNDLWW